MAYNKEHPKAAGKKLVELIYEFADGKLDMGDVMALQAFASALNQAKDELKTDTDAAVNHLISGATEEFGDRRINVPPAQ